jgi:hypothetical protein
VLFFGGEDPLVSRGSLVCVCVWGGGGGVTGLCPPSWDAVGPLHSVENLVKAAQLLRAVVAMRLFLCWGDGVGGGGGMAGLGGEPSQGSTTGERGCCCVVSVSRGGGEMTGSGLSQMLSS